MLRKRKISLWCMVLLYVYAGINHFIHPAVYLQIMPPWLLQPLMLVYISGVCEIVFGLLLLPAYTKRIAVWCIIFLLIAVFPANIQMTINYYREHNPYLWLTIVRLPLQVILIWWAWSFAINKTEEKSGKALI